MICSWFVRIGLNLMKLNLIARVILFTGFSFALHAQNMEDIPGSKDPSGLKRYEGTRTTFFDEKAFESYTLPLGKLTKKPNVNLFAKSLTLEGKVTKVTYVSNDPKRTALEVFRNYQGELAAGGWEILWEGTGEELSAGKGLLFHSLFPNRPGGTFAICHPGANFLAAKKGGSHLALFVANYKSGFVVPKTLQPKSGVPVIALDVIETQALEEKMVLVKAEEMASGILQQGAVNLYGFHFDTASATLKPESDATLDEVAKLLKSEPALRLLVVGHTDNVGKFDGNIELSQNRAASVVAALTQRLPAAAERLTPCGVGFQCPIASNSSEEGRAKNRRVALVKVEN